MKNTMAYPAGMIVPKTGSIRYQYRVPKALQQFYPRAVISENLKTTDRVLAIRMIYARKAELEVEYASHRPRLLAPAKTAITPDEARSVAQAMLASSAQADEEMRHLGMVGPFNESLLFGYGSAPSDVPSGTPC